MVAGKVRAAMGLHKSSPSTKAKPNQPSSPGPNPPSGGSSGGGSGNGTVFSRSFGVYFPKSSAQVQPRPPDVSELLRLVDDLRDREHRLKTELLEFKLLKESVAIVPLLEKQISSKTDQLNDALSRIRSLEAENDRLRSALEEERKQAEAKVKELEAENREVKETASRRVAEGEAEEDLSSSSLSNSQRFLGLTEAYSRPCLLRSYSNNNNKKGGVSGSIISNNNCKSSSMEEQKESVINNEVEAKPRHSRSNSEELVHDSASLTHHHILVKSRGPRVPKPPPPKRSVSSSLSSSSRECNDQASVAVTAPAAPPPPPPPPPPPRPAVVKKVAATAAAPPPPPPPPLKKGARAAVEKVRRVPEVVEFYHSLMRRDSRRDSGGSGAEVVLATANARDMIGEIENRSTHLLAIKTDVETQGDFIRFLIKEVEGAAFTEIEDVVPFVKWLDDELSYLVDERAVLKHFDWPEQKADALREAAFGYCDLKKLESEASSFRDDPRQPCAPALKKMQALLEKLEHGVYNLSRMRESASNRYKGFQIPMDWMLETGIISQIKLASVKLAMKYMKRVSAELESVGGGPEEEELIVQGVRFAFRVHQFAGGFDGETMRAFQELRDKARSCHVQCQNPQQQKFMPCKSTAC